jgi:hypothetical protein
MSTNDEDGPEIHRDRREHGGAPTHPDDDELARRTETERVAAGLEDYDPDDVPAATDADQTFNVTETKEYEEAGAEIDRQASEGKLYPLTEKHPFPPSHYDSEKEDCQ